MIKNFRLSKVFVVGFIALLGVLILTIPSYAACTYTVLMVPSVFPSPDENTPVKVNSAVRVDIPELGALASEDVLTVSLPSGVIIPNNEVTVSIPGYVYSPSYTALTPEMITVEQTSASSVDIKITSENRVIGPGSFIINFGKLVINDQVYGDINAAFTAPPTSGFSLGKCVIGKVMSNGVAFVSAEIKRIDGNFACVAINVSEIMPNAFKPGTIIDFVLSTGFQWDPNTSNDNDVVIVGNWGLTGTGNQGAMTKLPGTVNKQWYSLSNPSPATLRVTFTDEYKVTQNSSGGPGRVLVGTEAGFAKVQCLLSEKPVSVMLYVYSHNNPSITEQTLAIGQFVDEVLYNADLIDLQVCGQSVVGFDSKRLTYRVNVSTTTYDIPVVAAIPAHPNATCTIFQAQSLDGIEQERTATILVRSPNGSVTKTYKIIFIHSDISVDATLRELSTSAGSLNPRFKAGQFTYSLSLPNSVESIAMIPIVNESHATVTIDGVSVESGHESPAILMEAGKPKDISVVVTAQDGITTNTYRITVHRAALVTLDSCNPQVTVGNSPLTVRVPSDISNAVLTINTANVEGQKRATLPMLDVRSDSELGIIHLTIPDGTVVNGSADKWNGTINVPSIKANDSVRLPPESGQTTNVKSVIEVGFNDVPLFFDKAVRIMVPGQAGAEAGYYYGNTFIKITNNLHADSQEAGDALPVNGDGKISVGADLIIWTKHFTRFITYTQTPINSGSTGGGGVSQPPVDASEDTMDKESYEEPETSELGLTDITGHWAEESIRNLVKMGAIRGYPDKSFKPNAAINRAEFTAILVKAFQLTPTTGKVFRDTSNHWAEEEIATATAYGIVSGYDQSIFDPDGFLTREQMAVMIEKAARIEKASKAKVLTDRYMIADWAKDAVDACIAANVLFGMPDGSFQPKKTATRAEAATITFKAINLN